MSDVPFHATRMGRQFYDGTMRDLVKQLTRLNELLDRVLTQLEQKKKD